MDWTRLRRIEKNIIDRLSRKDTIYMPAKPKLIEPDSDKQDDSLHYYTWSYNDLGTYTLRKDIRARDTIKYPVMIDYVRHWIDSIRQIPLPEVRKELYEDSLKKQIS